MKQTTTHYKNFCDPASLDDLQKTVAPLGFSHWIYSSVASIHAPNNTAVTRISSYPTTFIDNYNSHYFSEIDPSTPYWLSHQQAASYRKVRNSVTLSPKQKSLMSLNRDHHVNKGIVIPLNNVLGFKSVLALSFDGSIKDLNAYIGDIQQTLFTTSQSFNRQFLSRHKSHFLASDIPTLTPQQTKVLRFMAEGLLTKQIADRLSISVNGVDKHIANIKLSLSAKTTTQAVILSVQWGLI